MQKTHPLTPFPFHSKEVDDIVYEVDCQLITVKPGADVDIGKYYPSPIYPRTRAY